MNNLNMNVQYIKGVGPKRASRLRKLNINTLLDLINYFPKDYEDKSYISLIQDSNIGDKATLIVDIVGIGQIIRPRRNMSILKVPFKDASGHGNLVWFNQPYLRDRFKIGDRLIVNGTINRMGMELQVVNPQFEKYADQNKLARIIPIYSLTQGLSNNELMKIVETGLEMAAGSLWESLPENLRKKYRLVGIKDAIENIHFPKSGRHLIEARRRLIFEELFTLQLGLLMMKNERYSEKEGIRFKPISQVEDFISDLPFKLTGAQRRVFAEIERDMDKPRQMNRLVQGDVGSGKTIIAALAIFRCVKAGYQAAMMAPTEILADQHYLSLSKLFDKWGIKCGLLVGSLTAKEKRELLEKIKEGRIDVVIGTHAIIQENIEFNKLGLAITDEQHRFGVKQRAVLHQKGQNPDILVMSATPIPRTLALILHGDLDISIIDELPPGRKEIETYGVGPNMIERVNNFIRKQVSAGRQAYIVCPLIEENDTLDLNSAEELYQKLKSHVFKDYRLGLLHGKMSAKEKDEIMKDFKDGLIDILVSTTVIEVGVDVPNANIMVIYNAERFGLAQLHQLRGRVGRGQYQSYCILINYGQGKIARERVRVLESSSDGFKISEKDLELRGPGEFFGTKQHGLPELRIANLFAHMDILKVAQKEAMEIVKSDPNLDKKENQPVKKKVAELFEKIEQDIVLN